MGYLGNFIVYLFKFNDNIIISFDNLVIAWSFYEGYNNHNKNTMGGE